MSTPWDRLYSAAHAPRMQGDEEKASLLEFLGELVEQGAAKAAAAQARRSGSKAFRSDEQEAALREENQKSFYRGSRER